MNYRLRLISLLYLCLFSCQHQKEKTETIPSEPREQMTTAPEIEFQVFKNDTFELPEASGYGYMIFINGRLHIYQPIIPAISGNKGFLTEGDAEEAARLISYKMKNQINPPSLTPAELDSLGIRSQ